MRDFNHSISVLVKAFFEGTLQHNNCYACAVGNLIADANNIQYHRICKTDRELAWLGFTSIYNTTLAANDQDFNWMAVIQGHGRINMSQYHGRRKVFIDATGYTVDELNRIELAFEKAKFGDDYTEWMFNGLMAVVDVLAEIHNIDLTAKEEAKALFVKV